MNPYNLTDAQLTAYSQQIAEERAQRSAMPGGEVAAFRAWCREWAQRQHLEAHCIKFGLPMPREQGEP